MNIFQLNRTFHKTHEAGAKRHPRYWLEANQIAAKVLSDLGLRVDDPALRTTVSLVVLRILDWRQPVGTPEVPTLDNIDCVIRKLREKEVSGG